MVINQKVMENIDYQNLSHGTPVEVRNLFTLVIFDTYNPRTWGKKMTTALEDKTCGHDEQFTLH